MLRIIKVAENYNKLPSEILGTKDEYLSFCLDEACCYIEEMIQARDTSGELLYYASWAEEREQRQRQEDNSEFLGWLEGEIKRF